MDNPDIALAVQKLLDDYVSANAAPIEILEAGCGSGGYLTYTSDCVLTGIDISQTQLERNELLSHRLHGDLQTYPLPKKRFDVVVCCNVLEHLEDPLAAMDNMLDAAKPDGLVIWTFPNLQSIKGLATKFTPHWFHIAVYRHILKIKDAGKNDTAPFPTPFKYAISPSAMQRYIRRRQVGVRYGEQFESVFQQRVKNNAPAIYYGMRSAGKVLELVSGKFIDGKNSDCAYVLSGRAA